MKSLNGFLGAQTWVVFLGHQAFLFATAVGFLYSVRRLTRRAAHLGRDPLGVLDGAALAALASMVVGLTWALYELVREEDARPLGVKPSARVAVALMSATVPVLFALLKRKHDSTKDSPRAAGRRA